MTTAVLPRVLSVPSWVRAVRGALLKIATAALVLVAAASITFFAQLLVPGDRATAILNQQTGRAQQYTAAELAPVNAQFGFDRPLIAQYLKYVTGLFHGDLGTSSTQHRPVPETIGAQMGPSLIPPVAPLAPAWVLAVGIPLLTVKRRRTVSALGSTWEALTASLPPY